jgi:hypothetical protein
VKSNNLANNKILVDEMVKAVGEILMAVDEILALHRSTLMLAYQNQLSPDRMHLTLQGSPHSNWSEPAPNTAHHAIYL